MVELREHATELAIGLFLLAGVLAWILIPVVFSADTIILVNPDTGGGPVSCLPSGALILAQNLTDLCDVTVLSPATNQILSYNGSQWVNVAGSVIFNDTTTCSNIGTGSAFVCVEGSNIQVRSILASTGLSATNNTNTITLTNTLPEATTASNLGANGEGVFSAEVGNDLQFKKILAGSAITVTSNSTNIIITNTAPENTTCSNQPTGIGLCINNDIDLKNLLNGTGIAVTTNITHVTFTNTGIISNQCNIGINCSGTNPSIFNTDFVNGTGISITGTTSQTFTNTGVTSLTSANGQISLSGSTGAVTITPKYQFLCQTTLVSSNASISCNDFPAKRFLMVEISETPTGGTSTPSFRFNGDGGNNYSARRSANGGADSTATGVSLIALRTVATSANMHIVTYIDNTTANEKLTNSHSDDIGTAGSANPPSRAEIVGKWTNTGSQITSIAVVNNGGTGTFNTGSTIIVWGYD